jgi:hypothetical protein
MSLKKNIPIKLALGVAANHCLVEVKSYFLAALWGRLVGFGLSLARCS